MGNFKVCVYAICKNEEAFAARWMASMGEADGIYVLDTGSTDGTAEALRALGAQVTVEVISPWRFDAARNRSLDLVPEDADICVCTDLDEILRPGWRSALEAAWAKSPGRLRYRYTWSFRPDGSEGVVFLTDKVHCRRGYRWAGPVHEILRWVGSGPEPEWTAAPGVQLDHHPDPGKSRGQYLPLLELAVSEDPENDRNMHYLGREYFFYGRFEDCVSTLLRHLALPAARWEDERCASMRYLAKAYQALGQPREAERWRLRAIAEAPHLREPWMDFARDACETESWNLLIWLTERALAIRERPGTYMTEPDSWGALPHDLRSLGCFYTGRYGEALDQVEKALALDPKNMRLQKNKALMVQAAR